MGPCQTRGSDRKVCRTGKRTGYFGFGGRSRTIWRTKAVCPRVPPGCLQSHCHEICHVDIRVSDPGVPQTPDLEKELGCLKTSLAFHSGASEVCKVWRAGFRSRDLLHFLTCSNTVNTFAGASWLLRNREWPSLQPWQPFVSMATTGPRKTKKCIGPLQKQQLPLNEGSYTECLRKKTIYGER